jgi:hypothetical protein
MARKEVGMGTIFTDLGAELYTALFEPDPEQRRAAIDAWVDKAVPHLSAAVGEEVRAYLNELLQGRRTPEGWQSAAQKFSRIMDTYQLVMDIKLRTIGPREEPLTVGSNSSEVRQRLLDAAQRALEFVEAAQKSKQVGTDRQGDEDADAGRARTAGGGFAGRSGRTGPSPNDQRSNVMNPNNPAHRAAANNRSNQMNPNNPGYRSSRGGGGGRRR